LQELVFDIGKLERHLLVNWKDEDLVAMEMLVKNKSLKAELPGNHFGGTK